MTRPSIVIVTDNPNSWSVSRNEQLVARLRSGGHDASLVHDVSKAPKADIAAFLNCERIIPAHERARFRTCVVVHASDLPRGRGWSPLTWSILGGASTITLTLFEAADEVDSGPIYLQQELRFEGHELIDELRDAVARGSEALIVEFASRWPDVPGQAQVGDPSHHARRRPADSRLDPDRSLRESFNLLRVVDNERYPAFFEHAGYIYELRITKRGPVE